MSDYKIELRPQRGKFEMVLNMLSDVGVVEHCDSEMTVAQDVDKHSPRRGAN